MALAHVCDGTGETAALDDLELVGPLGRAYTARAAKVAHEYLSAVDELHRTCAEEFQTGLKTLRELFRAEIGGGRLPDE